MTVHREAAPLRAQVVAMLRAAIVGGELAPGARLVERVLCERFDVSRTVIREALRGLESEGLVEMWPHRGPAVTRLSEGDARSLYEVREVLEGLAGRAFAQRASPAQREALRAACAQVGRADGVTAMLAAKDAFYDALLDGAGNDVARAQLRGIHARVSMLRGRTLQAPGRPAASRAELAAITDAAVAGDAEAAWTACVDHVRSAAAVALTQTREHG